MSEDEGITRGSGHKRPRLDSEQPAAAQLIRDEFIWFEDGNIIVTAGPDSEGSTYVFKCHKGTLAKKATIFEQAFRLPNQSGSETIDELPVVHLTDHWEDVRDFLRMMYGCLKIPVSTRHSDTVKQIGGALRLATKYDVSDMAEQLGAFLKRDWPSTLYLWTIMEAQTDPELQSAMEAAEAPGIWDVNEHVPDPASAVRLAQEARIASALRAAWYGLARSYGQEAMGFREDLNHYMIYIKRRTADLSLLDADDLRRLINGRQRLRDATANIIRTLRTTYPFNQFGESYPPGQDIYYPNQMHQKRDCHVQLLAWLNKWAGKNAPSNDIARDPLGVFLRMEKEFHGASHRNASLEAVCPSCKRFASRALKQITTELWDDLEDIFSLRTLGLEEV